MYLSFAVIFLILYYSSPWITDLESLICLSDQILPFPKLFVTSNTAKFHVNLSFSIIVFCTFLSNILAITNLEISSTNGAPIFINICSFGYSTICSFARKGIDLFKKLKHDFLEFIMPPNSTIFFMPNTRSTFSCICDTNVKILNL